MYREHAMASNADPVEIDGNAHAPRRDDVSAGRRALRRDQEIIGNGMASRIRSLFALQGGTIIRLDAGLATAVDDEAPAAPRAKERSVERA
jgi:hypothetical protein